MTVVECENHDIACDNGETTVSDYICDGDDDCGDNSDEICMGLVGKYYFTLFH